MQISGQTLQLSASDLVGHINCRYLTQLDLKVARGSLPKPIYYDPTLEVLISAVVDTSRDVSAISGRRDAR